MALAAALDAGAAVERLVLLNPAPAGRFFPLSRLVDPGLFNGTEFIFLEPPRDGGFPGRESNLPWLTRELAPLLRNKTGRKIAFNRAALGSLLAAAMPTAPRNDFFERLVEDAAAADPKIFLAYLWALRSLDLSPRLPGLATPTLLLWGDLDTVVPLPAVVHLQSLLPRRQLQIINGVGHSPQVENPPLFADLAGEFLLSPG
ncbi:MAG: alpha/beta hydrolase [Bacillota bacterium]